MSILVVFWEEFFVGQEGGTYLSHGNFSWRQVEKKSGQQHAGA